MSKRPPKKWTNPIRAELSALTAAGYICGNTNCGAQEFIDKLLSLTNLTFDAADELAKKWGMERLAVEFGEAIISDLRAQLAAVTAERDALRGQVAALKEALQRPAERYHVAGPSDVGLPVMDDKGNEYPLIAGRGTPAQPTE